MILVSDQKWELCLEAFHYVSATARIALLLQLDGPVDEHALHEEVKTDHELDSLLSLLNGVQSLCKRVHL